MIDVDIYRQRIEADFSEQSYNESWIEKGNLIKITDTNNSKEFKVEAATKKAIMVNGTWIPRSVIIYHSGKSLEDKNLFHLISLMQWYQSKNPQLIK
jgi:hypothetical protein